MPACQGVAADTAPGHGTAIRRSLDDPEHTLTRTEKWSPLVLFQIWLYFAFCFIAVDQLPNTIWDPELRQVTILIGTLGIWRYSWWMTHAVRAVIYGRRVFPELRRQADAVWAQGVRPRRVHYMMTTFKEHREVTERVILSIIRETRRIGVPATLWLGSGDRYDEDIIQNYLRLNAKDLDLEFVMIRQNQPGKRLAIGLVLRAMSRAGINREDIIVFVDGDSILGTGCVEKCVSLFQADPELQAVTTDEEVICYGPPWVRKWLTMRFGQRRLAMKSHALAGKVLTLTGRMSVFRANHLTRKKFIRLLEADHLQDWIWGKFRFLSGDDKSTWYYMLTADAKMLYVQDAMVYTVEYIEGNGIDRMVQNFRRWSGNMLRNGSRAIALGPRKIGLFIWWCVVDQRIAMWTMLVSPILAILATWLHTPSYLVSYLVWIAVSRMMLSLILCTYCRRVDLWYPLILYVNQLLNASVKVYILFRLAKQRWSNRGNQTAGFDTSLLHKVRTVTAAYITTLYLCVLVISLLIYTQLIDLPTVNLARALLVG